MSINHFKFLQPWTCAALFSLSMLCSATTLATEIKDKPHRAGKARKALVPKEDTSGEFANFTQWKEVAAFIDHMVTTYQFDKTALEQLFRKTRYVETTIQLIKPAPPGRPKNWQMYRARFVEPVRIENGIQFWNRYADALERAETQYGVPAEIIVGIIGVETIYGRNTGKFRVLDALTTLAFDYPQIPARAMRMDFFRGELENVLVYARDAEIDPFSLLGSYAGAIGWPQFMPGSIRKFAVDFDNDGKIDLRTSPIDAIGSVANFLVQHGWKRGEPIVFPTNVNLAKEPSETNRWETLIGQGLEAKYKLDELKTAGVLPNIDPPSDMLFGLVDLQNGVEPTEYWLGTENFFAITQYNRSFFYAMSVVDLGRAVRTARNSTPQ